MARKPSLRKQIDNLLSHHSATILSAFLASIADVRSDIVMRRIVEALERRDINAALDALNLDRAAFGRVEAVIAEAYNAGGAAMVGNLPTLRDQSGGRLFVRFDVRNPRAESWLRQHSSNLITGLIEDQRTAIRSVLETGLQSGLNPNRSALDIVGRISRATGRREGGLIGLSGQQTGFVEAARDELLSGDPSLMRNYLTRARRDRRFDNTVLRAINEERPLDLETVNRLVGRYSDGLLKLRGETIARTEALAALHAAKDEGFRQGLDKTNYPPEAVTRIWRSAGDDRVRHTHADMNGQQVQGLDAPFQSSSGALLKFPGDTSLGAGAAEVINCRCDTDYRIDFSFGVE